MLELKASEARKGEPYSFSHVAPQLQKGAYMTGLSFKSAVFFLVIVCFLSGSAVADTFTITTGDAFENSEAMDFILSHSSSTQVLMGVLPSSGFAQRGLC